jgi:hypothetical protein
MHGSDILTRILQTEFKTGEPDWRSVSCATGIILKSIQDRHFKLGVNITRISQIRFFDEVVFELFTIDQDFRCNLLIYNLDCQ